MKVDVLLGLQWGDEGKGKIVDVLTPKYDIIKKKRRHWLRTDMTLNVNYLFRKKRI